MHKLESGEETTVIVAKGDIQIPFHDTRAVRVLRRVIEDVQPDIIVDIGDWLDLPDLSTKFATKPDHKNQIALACQIAKEQFDKEMEVSPNSRYIWIEGNHEKRLRSFVEQRAEALSVYTKGEGLLTLPSMVGIKERVEYIYPYGAVWKFKYGGGHSFIFKHGEATTKYSAMRELETAHENGMSGHTHRMNFSMTTTYEGPHGWWSLGCLCNIRGKNCPPGYTETDQYRNWQQGFAVITFSKERALFQVEPVLVHEGATIFRGKAFVDTGSLDKKRISFK